MISLKAIGERKLVHWALAYLAGAWALLQVADLIGARFGWPDVWLRGLIVVLVIGFLAALVLAWYHGEKGRQSVGAIELGMLTALLVLAGASVGWVRATTPAAAAPAADAVVAEQGSIAVLPFADLSPEGDQAYFSDGIAEELLNVLAQIPALRVASRTSAFSFQGSDVPVDSIARALNVRHVLEGSVRTAGSQVRITAQLIDASTGFHVWSETYDRELKDIFALQDEISRQIVAQLRLRLAGGDAPLASVQTRDPEAHTMVLKAVQMVRAAGTAASVENALALLSQAVERDPDYARAWAERATVRELQVYSGYVPRAEGLPRVRADARRALALDSTDARAHYVLGIVASDYDWDWQQADAHYASAIRHHPGFSPAYGVRAWLLMRLGRTQESLAAARRSLELDPVATEAHNVLAAMLLYDGHDEQAAALLEEALRLDPTSSLLLANMAMLRTSQQLHVQAIRSAAKAVELAPDRSYVVGVVALTHARAGNTAEARRALAQFRAMPNPSPYLQALVHAGLGEREATLTLLEQAVEVHDASVPDLGVEPLLADYRDEPRVRRLLERMGLPSS